MCYWDNGGSGSGSGRIYTAIWIRSATDPATATGGSWDGNTFTPPSGTALTPSAASGTDTLYVALVKLEVPDPFYFAWQDWDTGAGGAGAASDFLGLTDTPSAYTGQAGKLVAVNTAENALVFATDNSGVSTFVALTDTPNDLSGQGGKILKVNSEGNALILVDETDTDTTYTASDGVTLDSTTFKLTNPPGIVTVNSTGSIATTAFGKSVYHTGSNASTLTLPATASGNNGKIIRFFNTGTSTITLDGNESETIDGSSTKTLAAGKTVSLLQNGSIWSTVSTTVDNDTTYTSGIGIDISDTNAIGIDESAFDDTGEGTWYSLITASEPDNTLEFALADTSGTFVSVDSNTNWSNLAATGRLYFFNTQGTHTGAFGAEGSKTIATLESGDKLHMQDANGSAPTITFTISSGPTAFGSDSGKWYAYSSVEVDAAFATPDDDSVRFSDERQPAIKIPAAGVKGGDATWVRLDADNLTEFTGASYQILVTDNEDNIKEQPYDDFNAQHAPLDTIIRFSGYQRVNDNTDTPEAGGLSLHTVANGLTPVKLTAVNARHAQLLQKFLVLGQRIKLGEDPWVLTVENNPTKTNNIFTFNASEANTRFGIGSIVPMYTIGRRLVVTTEDPSDKDLLQYDTDRYVPQTAKDAGLVERTDLEGLETDEFASYVNALFGGTYFPGNFCFFSQSSQPTDDTNAIGWPHLTSGSGTLVWGDLRDDSNPDNSWTPETLVAADWPSGRIVHISPWHPFLQNGHVKVTLTSGATLVGTGNGQHLWAAASWEVIGSVSGDTTSDYFRWSEIQPSDIDIELPPEAIVNPPWPDENEFDVASAVPANPDNGMLWSDTATQTLKRYRGSIVEDTGRYTDLTGISGSPHGFVAHGEHAWVIDRSANKAYHFKVVDFGPLIYDGSRNFDLDSANTAAVGGCTDGTYIWIGDNGTHKGYAYNFDTGARETTRDITFDTENRNATSLGTDNSVVWVADSSDGKAYAHSIGANMPRNTGKDIDWSSEGLITSPHGFAYDNGKMWIVDAIDDRAYGFTVSNSDAVRNNVMDFDMSAGSTPVAADFDNGAIWVTDNGSPKRIHAYPVEGFYEDISRIGQRFAEVDNRIRDVRDNRPKAFDTGNQSDSTDVSNHPVADALPMPSLDISNVVSTETIANFGTVYKTEEPMALDWSFNVDAQTGVGIQLRYSQTKPTASDSANTIGDLCIQANDATTGRCIEFAMPENTYWWLALSGGSANTLTDRSIRLRGIQLKLPCQ